MLIKDRLAAVNFFLGCVGVVQCSRIFLWRQSQKGGVVEEVKAEAAEVKAEVKEAIKA